MLNTDLSLVDSVMAAWDPELVVEGAMRTGAQEHFYLETHATIAIPRLASIKTRRITFRLQLSYEECAELRES